MKAAKLKAAPRVTTVGGAAAMRTDGVSCAPAGPEAAPRVTTVGGAAAYRSAGAS
jgi:hypothetical protein